jgi:hypothetical protein
MNPRFVEIARDPHLIPGVYEHCDQWCSYCPVTRRCLAHRCMVDYAKMTGRPASGTVFRDREELVQFTRDVAAAVGTTTPELDALLAGPVIEGPLAARDSLTDLAFEYAMGASIVLGRTASQVPPPRDTATRPTPLEVALWFHVLIVTRVFRAVVSAAQAAAGQADRADDANGCAKVALVGIARSRDALRRLPVTVDEPAIAELISRLDALEASLDDRFPQARAFIRPGLDVPVA